MASDLIVSISREYGSGGREIGEKLASRLGFAYYDKQLLKRVAEESGFCDEVVEEYDEKPLKKLLFNPHSFITGFDIDSTIPGRIRSTEFDLIRNLCEEGPCVIIGRGVDSLLAENPHLIRLFVSAPMPERIARVMRRNDIGEDAARERIAKTDKERAAYYRYFTEREWGIASNYDLCINSGPLTIEDCVDVTASYIERFHTRIS